MPFVSSRPALQLTKEELEDLEKASKSRTQPQRTVERARSYLSIMDVNQFPKLQGNWGPIDLK